MAATFYRYETDLSEENDELLNVIGMIVTDLKRKRLPDGSYEWKFSIIQKETTKWTSVTYNSASVEQELRLSRLFNVVGTLVFMNNCLIRDKNIILEHIEQMAIIAFRPNEFQANNFLKAILHKFLIKLMCFE